MRSHSCVGERARQGRARRHRRRIASPRGCQGIPSRLYGRSAQEPQKLQAAQALAVTNSSLRKTPRLLKKPMRVSETERTPPTLVSHILVRRVRGGYPPRPLNTGEVGGGSRPPF